MPNHNFRVGDRVVVSNPIPDPYNGDNEDEGYHGDYYRGDEGTVVDYGTNDGNIFVDFDDDRTDYLVKVSELHCLTGHTLEEKIKEMWERQSFVKEKSHATVSNW